MATKHIGNRVLLGIVIVGRQEDLYRIILACKCPILYDSNGSIGVSPACYHIGITNGLAIGHLAIGSSDFHIFPIGSANVFISIGCTNIGSRNTCYRNGELVFSFHFVHGHTRPRSPTAEFGKSTYNVAMGSASRNIYAKSNIGSYCRRNCQTNANQEKRELLSHRYNDFVRLYYKNSSCG